MTRERRGVERRAHDDEAKVRTLSTLQSSFEEGEQQIRHEVALVEFVQDDATDVRQRRDSSINRRSRTPSVT